MIRDALTGINVLTEQERIVWLPCERAQTANECTADVERVVGVDEDRVIPLTPSSPVAANLHPSTPQNPIEYGCRWRLAETQFDYSKRKEVSIGG